jgi:hypothetical protein
MRCFGSLSIIEKVRVGKCGLSAEMGGAGA